MMQSTAIDFNLCFIVAIYIEWKARSVMIGLLFYSLGNNSQI